jgi:hypothetical protein
MRQILRVFGYELRKIWQWKLLLIIAVFSVMSFYVFETAYFMQTRPWLGFNEHFAFVYDLKAEYGATLDYDEWRDSQRIIDGYKAELTAIIVSDTMFAEYGVACADELLEIDGEFHEVDWNELTDEERGRLEIISYMSNDAYYAVLKIALAEESRQKLGEHFTANESAELNIFYGNIIRHKTYYFRMNITTIIISVGILLTPYTVRDKQSKIMAQQFVSRTGRRILPVQITAMMLSAFGLTAIMLAAYFGLYFRENSAFLSLLNQRVNVVSGFDFYDIWLDLTFLQYLALISGITLLFVTALALLLFRFLLNSRDYVSAILKAIPLIVFLSILSIGAVGDIMHEINTLYDMFSVRGIEFIVSGIVLAAGITMCALAYKRVARTDLL